MQVLKIEVRTDFKGNKEETRQEVIERFIRLAVMNAIGLDLHKGTINNMLKEPCCSYKLVEKKKI